MSKLDDRKLVDVVGGMQAEKGTVEKATTRIGWTQALAGLGVTYANADPGDWSFWLGIIISVLLGVQGQLTNKV